MAYVATTWVQGVTTLGPTNLNHIEGGIQTADATATAAVPKSVVTVAGDLVYATGSAAVTRLGIGSATQVLKGGASAPAWGAVALTELSGYPADATKFARGDGTWAVPLAGTGLELGYTEFTSAVAISATSEATANVVVTSAGITFDGTPVIVEFYSPDAVNGASSNLKVVLHDDTGASFLGQLAQILSSGAAQDTNPVLVRRRFTPAAGTRTYSIRAWTSSAAASVSAGVGGAGTDLPGFIRFTKV